jgi:hypothetical protein
MAITLSAKSLRLLKYLADHGGDQADEKLGEALEKAIEKVAARLHRSLLQEQGTPYGDDAALKSANDYGVALTGETEPEDADVKMASSGRKIRAS